MMVRVDTADRRWLRSWRWTKGSAFSSTTSSLCAGGGGAAVANAIHNATGVRVRDYPITIKKHLGRLPASA